MRLQRKIVKRLQKRNENGAYPTRTQLVEILSKDIFLRVNYFFLPRFRAKINDALGDSIAPYKKRPEDSIEYYIDYENEEKRDELKVTKRGRDYIHLAGGLEELLRKRAELTAFLIGGGIFGLIGSAIGWIISRNQDLISKLIEMR